MAGKKKPNLLYVVILGVAGVGLAVDTFILRADAGTVAVTTENQADAQTSSVGAPKVMVKNEPLGERFDEAMALLASPAFRRLDGFSKPNLDSSEPVQSTEGESVGVGFASRHRLTAVLSQPSGDLAVVDGLLLRIGEKVEGLRLTKIENDGVYFESEGKTIRLPLARPGFDR